MRPLALILFSSILSGVACFAPGSANWAEQGFYFDWNNDTAPLPTPITAQCESINIKWSRGAGTGPDPAAPYVFKVYTSHYLTPIIVDAGNGLSTTFPVPFDPGTQYVICMTDQSGVSGGCQDLYTVYPSGNTSCSNVTVPETLLGVNMKSIDTGGLLSRYGWPASCTDLQFDIADGAGGGVVGTPPYTLTVAPAFRTPLNITFDSSVRWTVTLDHGHPFFVSISDSQGITWTNGPLHAGAGSMDCFNPTAKDSRLTLGASLGMSFSFLVVGFVLALLLAWLIQRRREIRFSNGIQPYVTPPLSQESKSIMSARSGLEARVSRRHTPNLHLRRPPHNRASSSNMMLMHDRPGSNGADLTGSPTTDEVNSPLSQQSFPEARRRSTADDVRITPYLAVPEAAHGSTPIPKSLTRLNSRSSNNGNVRQSLEMSGEPRTSTPTPMPGGSSSSAPHHAHRPSIPHSNQSQQDNMHDVYVVHHDAGLPPPVTVFTRPGTRVTELPPGYDHLIPYPQDATTERFDSVESRRQEKHRASSSASRPPNSLSTGSSPNGLSLANAEDLPPPSAATPTPGNGFPIPNPSFSSGPSQ